MRKENLKLNIFWFSFSVNGGEGTLKKTKIQKFNKNDSCKNILSEIVRL